MIAPPPALAIVAGVRTPTLAPRALLLDRTAALAPLGTGFLPTAQLPLCQPQTPAISGRTATPARRPPQATVAGARTPTLAPRALALAPTRAHAPLGIG